MTTVILIAVALVIGYLVAKNPEKVKVLVQSLKERFKRPSETTSVPPATPMAPPPENVAVAPSPAVESTKPAEVQGRFGPFLPSDQAPSSFGPKNPF